MLFYPYQSLAAKYTFPNIIIPNALESFAMTVNVVPELRHSQIHILITGNLISPPFPYVLL